MGPLHLPILVHNDAFVAVDKPTGISVHNAEDETNLLELLEKELKLPKLFPVHRLDKETSGVQILALNEAAAKKLSENFQKRTVQKIYVGLLRGSLTENQGTWTWPLSDKGEGRKNPSGLAKDRVPCETQFKILKSSKYFCLVEFDLITGRQHQIRKHCALAKHALVGDPRYGDGDYNKKMAQLYKSERMFLHCKSVDISGQKIESPLPEIFEGIFA